MNIKKIAVYAGVGVIWAGGVIITWKLGELIGKGTGKACSVATEKLLTLV